MYMKFGCNAQINFCYFFRSLNLVLVAIYVLWLFLAVPWVGLRCVIVVFPDHTHLLFNFYHGHLVNATPPAGLAL